MRTQTAIRTGLLAMAGILAVSPALAARPNIDVTAQPRRQAGSTSSVQQWAQDPGFGKIARIEHVDERFDVPNFVWATRHEAKASPPSARMQPSETPEVAARDHLARLAPIYRLTAGDVSGAKLKNVHDTGRGGIIATFAQKVDGIDVFRDEIKVLMRRDLQLVSVSGYIPGKDAGREAIDRTFELGIQRAVELAGEDYYEGPSLRGAYRSAGKTDGDYELFDLAIPSPTLSEALDVGQPVRAKPVYFHRPEGLEPGYYVEIIGAGEAYSYVISARDGSVLYRNSLMANDAFSYRVWADASSDHIPTDGPQGDSPSPNPNGTATGYDPAFVAPSLITLQNGPISTNDPWLPGVSTSTLGNNVDAYVDIVSPDGFSAGDLRASTTAANTFDRTYDVNLDPGSSSTQRMAAVTQLFYVNNFLHDWYYDSGFDEAAGNAQSTNYGRGGAQNDRLKAEGQDFGGTDNANMTTPADGSSPRMQMYTFTGAGAVKVTANAPGAVAGDYSAGYAQFGPQTFSVTAAVVEAIDGAAPTSDGCTAFVNAGAISGKIALIDRGSCTFVAKAANAEAAGAVGVLIVDNQVAATPPILGGTGTIGIPVLSVTNADGATLRAQLGSGLNITLSRGPAIDPDGTIDNSIISHEWGHYISNRLINDANGLGNNQGASMGEGWGDFTALLMMVKEGDDLLPNNTNFSGAYTIGSYALHSPGSLDLSYYFGIRRVPYSTDFGKDGLTFKHIENGVALPVGPPTAFGADGASNAEVHNSGEVWCSMLWECYAELLNSGRLTFTEARDRMRDYLVAAYKLTPANPTFTEARDAVLAAAAATDVDDFVDFWQAFARRGIGMGAVSPARSSTTHSGVVESFVVGGDLALSSIAITDDVSSCDSDGYLDDGEVGTLTVSLENTGATLLSSTSATVSSANPNVSFPEGNVLNFPSSAPFGITSAPVQIVLFGGSGLQDIDIHVDFDDPGLLVAGPRMGDASKTGNVTATPSNLETVEAASPPWDMVSGVGSSNWSVVTAAAFDHHFFAPDVDGISDQYLISPPLDLGPGLPFIIDFDHAYSFEKAGANNYDGGVIEISNSGGLFWSNVSSYGSPGYGGTIYASSGNPLAGKQAYVGHNASYPATDHVSVDLGTAFAGQTVLIRFRLGTDAASGDYGWQIDNIEFQNITNQPFEEIAADVSACNMVDVGDSRPTEWGFAIAGANPVLDRAQFRFALPQQARVDLSIFDVTGRRVAKVADGAFSAGYHDATWGAKSVPAGVYFARLRAGDREFKQRILVVH